MERLIGLGQLIKERGMGDEVQTMSPICFIVVLISCAAAYKQTFIATGTLQCRGKPAAGQQVQMKITDRLMKGKVASTVSAGNKGQFKIKGSEDSKERKSAYLWIEHQCDPKNRAIKEGI
ncbi:Transthyretin-like family protein [Oesophagostomum dentatum]|uniref:Transthyretin-like family protein n=1 Tax=Oesophagostomum dentatum TaxID=61180 RepID=A0A0B1THY3_OESDE|nr:Transthyretin-like family protein [Oesophagostomum dentatum]